jgi:hypothetical protein
MIVPQLGLDGPCGSGGQRGCHARRSRALPRREFALTLAARRRAARIHLRRHAGRGRDHRRVC